MPDLRSKLNIYKEKYDELLERLGSPEVSSDPEKIKEYGKQVSDLEEIVKLSKKYSDAISALDDAQEMLNDEKEEEMKDFLKEEIDKNTSLITKYERKIKLYMTPKDPNDEKDVIVEIRAGAGGDEAALFAEVLFRMYTKYSEGKNWKYSILSSNKLGIGGFKEIIFDVTGKKVYSTLKYESGVHRVQRIPVTESGGRIHTSTATVAVLPEAEEVEVEIDPNDLKIDVFRSSGPGGQSVNTTDSAVRITHLPSGIVISCQDEKSQLQNKAKGLKILRARLLEAEQQKQMDEQTESRRTQIGTGDRSERIRTYNYPQGRVTDHRINLTLYKLDEILEGSIDELVEALRLADEEKKIAQIGE